MSRKLAIAVVLSLIVACASTAWAADDVQTGTWKANVSKSHYKTATPPQSQVVNITPQGNGVKVMVTAVNPKGEKLVVEYSAQYDGKEYPRTETGAGAVQGQTVSLKKIDARTVERVAYLKGKKLTVEKWEISADGKTRTVTQSGVGADGKPVDNLIIYDRQN